MRLRLMKRWPGLQSGWKQAIDCCRCIQEAEHRAGKPLELLLRGLRRGCRYRVNAKTGFMARLESITVLPADDKDRFRADRRRRRTDPDGGTINKKIGWRRKMAKIEGRKSAVAGTSWQTKAVATPAEAVIAKRGKLEGYAKQRS